jgi:hypothetical protein
VNNSGRSAVRQGRVGRGEAQTSARRILIACKHPRFAVWPDDGQRSRLGGYLAAARFSAARRYDSDACQAEDADSQLDRSTSANYSSRRFRSW